jgi:hypothetical protein
MPFNADYSDQGARRQRTAGAASRSKSLGLADFSGPSHEDLREVLGGDDERAHVAAVVLSHGASEIRVLACLLVELLKRHDK